MMKQINLKMDLLKLNMEINGVLLIRIIELFFHLNMKEFIRKYDYDLFEVELNGKKGYVDLNGTEYFEDEANQSK